MANQPSKPFVEIPDSDIAPNRPITTDLMTRIRDSLINLNERVTAAR